MQVRILYTNWKSATEWRRIQPISIEFIATEWHPEEQWILHATDLDKGVERSFAMKNIQRWEE